MAETNFSKARPAKLGNPNPSFLAFPHVPKTVPNYSNIIFVNIFELFHFFECSLHTLDKKLGVATVQTRLVPPLFNAEIFLQVRTINISCETNC